MTAPPQQFAATLRHLIICLFASGALFAGEELRLLSYNLRHGTAMDGSPAMDRQIAIMKRVNADVIGLQEIDKNCGRSGAVDQPAILAKGTQSSSHFGSFMNYNGGQYGMAMLSKLKVTESKVLRLPAGREPRVAVILELLTAQKNRLLVANVHFDWTDEALRAPQAKALIAYLDTKDIAAVVLGDYNAAPGSATLELFRQAGFRFLDKPKDKRLTWNAREPSVEIDHVAIRNAANTTLHALSIEVLDEPESSDHRPVFATLRIESKVGRE